MAEEHVDQTSSAFATSLDEAADSLIGKVIDSRFEIKSLIGCGGMGKVYRAHSIHLDIDVAIKIIHAQCSPMLTV